MKIDEVPLGTLYLDEDGTAYRLVDVDIDWDEDDPVKRLVPEYAVQSTSGINSSTHRLPVTAVLVWSPSADSRPVQFPQEIRAAFDGFSVRKPSSGA